MVKEKYNDHMRKVLNLLFAYLILISQMFFTGCGKEDDDPIVTPTATASFNLDRKFTEVGETITFTNTSNNAVRYEWDFGNGESSTNPNPTVKYDTIGTYTVLLKAFNAENVIDTMAVKVKVGYRYLTGITIKSLNFLKPNGAPWDSGSGPDLRFYVSSSADPGYKVRYTLRDDVTQSMLPVKYSGSASSSYNRFSDRIWFFSLHDDDGTTEEVMAEFQQNPMNSPKDYETGKGTFSLVNGDVEIDILFEIHYME